MWPWCVGTFKGVEFLFSFGEFINVLDFYFHFREQLHHVPLLAKESQNNMKRRCDFFLSFWKAVSVPGRCGEVSKLCTPVCWKKKWIIILPSWNKHNPTARLRNCTSVGFVLDDAFNSSTWRSPLWQAVELAVSVIYKLSIVSSSQTVP